MPGRLEGKIALVSGSTQGFGRGILETFIREGAVVLGLDLQATDGPVDGYSEDVAYQIKANVAEEQSWVKAVISQPPSSTRLSLASSMILTLFV
jgi:NAD(P)-dependent dehydrogenase (short-subunit alcohol dehydrogenase family)